jgi:hypothetical protein
MRTICALALTLLVGCAPESRQQLGLPVHAESLDLSSFSMADGSEILLDEAWIVLSDLRLEEPGGEASAKHPGHDFSGATSCELLGTWELDLLGEPTDLGQALCLDGQLATGRLVLAADPAVVLAGTATPQGGGARDFEFRLVLDDEITGIPIDAWLDAAAPPAGLAVGISPAAMLAWVDWESADTDQDDILTTADDLLGNTVPFGVVSTASYTLTIEE